MTDHKVLYLYDVKRTGKYTISRKPNKGSKPRNVYLYDTCEYMSKNTIVLKNKEIVLTGSYVNDPIYYPYKSKHSLTV